jgi:uncharacterized protein YcfL
MRTKWLLALLTILLLSGCKTGFTPTFVQSVKEHKMDTILVNDSLIASLEEERDRETRPAAKEAYQEIINNLTTISHQADVLYRYVWEEMSEDDLSAVLKARWRTNP